MTTILVTGAGGPMGCNVTRSLRLAPEGYRLIGTDANPLHLPLRLTDEIHRVPLAKDLDAYLDALDALIERYEVDLVFPTHPVEVRTISAHRDRLKAATFLPTHDAILRGQDKYASYEAWSAAGVPVLNPWSDIE